MPVRTALRVQVLGWSYVSSPECKAFHDLGPKRGEHARYGARKLQADRSLVPSPRQGKDLGGRKSPNLRFDASGPETPSKTATQLLGYSRESMDRFLAPKFSRTIDCDKPQQAIRRYSTAVRPTHFPASIRPGVDDPSRCGCSWRSHCPHRQSTGVPPTTLTNSIVVLVLCSCSRCDPRGGGNIGHAEH